MISLLNNQSLVCKELERAVKNFCQESDTEYNSVENKQGLYQQTMQNIGNIVVNKPNNQFLWIDVDEVGTVNGYVLTHISRDVDNELCYYMTQAWLHPKFRNTKYSHETINLLRSHAKTLLCKHIIVVSSRNTKAYIRFLRGKFKPYVTLLKEDI